MISIHNKDICINYTGNLEGKLVQIGWGLGFDEDSSDFLTVRKVLNAFQSLYVI